MSWFRNRRRASNRRSGRHEVVDDDRDVRTARDREAAGGDDETPAVGLTIPDTADQARDPVIDWSGLPSLDSYRASVIGNRWVRT